jgi:hypothetical protein
VTKISTAIYVVCHAYTFPRKEKAELKVICSCQQENSKKNN